MEATKECGGVLCKGAEVDPALIRDRLGWTLLRTFLPIVRHLPVYLMWHKDGRLAPAEVAFLAHFRRYMAWYSRPSDWAMW